MSAPSLSVNRARALQRSGTASVRPPSRPPSTRPPTRASMRASDDPGSYIVAVTSSQGTGMDIGIAAMNLDTMKVYITQIADTHTYARTLHHLTIYRPRKIIVPDTFFPQNARKGREPAVIMTCIEDEFGVDCEPVARSHWSADAGLDFIKRLAVEEVVNREHIVSKVATLMAVEDKHFARCATSALFKYLEQKDDMIFSLSSVFIRYVALEGTMFIDHDTIANLELVSNNLSQNKHTLLSVVNRSKTPMAKRLLRATILQPSTVEEHITRRLDVVGEFLGSQELFDGVQTALTALPKIDVEKLTAKLIAKRARNPQTCSTTISNLLELRDVIQALPAIVDATFDGRNPLLKAIGKALADDRCSAIEGIISDTLSVESTSRLGGWSHKYNILFAVRADCHKLLDVARATYKENCEDVASLADEINDRYSINCKLVWTAAGYFLQVDAGQALLSPDFINVTQMANKLRFTHPSIVKANARMHDSEEEILLLSDSIVNTLREEVVNHIGCLYTVSEGVSPAQSDETHSLIALLDLLWGFADYAIGNQCVRPEFVDTLAISKGRHPILDLARDGDFVCNDGYAEDGLATFQLIGGPNMAGKTTYLKMIGLLTIQSMLGCYVPAQYASVRLHDALLSKLGNGDSMQRELSTFAQEMATMSMILGVASSKSLVLIDELGRGTSPEEGVGIAHALAEAMMKIKAWTYFTTHFRQLSTTLAGYPGFVNLHLAVQQATKSTDRAMTFRYKVEEGPCLAEHYGLELAKLASLPDEVIDLALKVASSLADAERKAIEESKANILSIRKNASLELLARLEQTVRASRLTGPDLVRHLQEIQQECINQLLQAKLIEESAVKLTNTAIPSEEGSG